MFFSPFTSLINREKLCVNRIHNIFSPLVFHRLRLLDFHAIPARHDPNTIITKIIVSVNCFVIILARMVKTLRLPRRVRPLGVHPKAGTDLETRKLVIEKDKRAREFSEEPPP